MKRRKLKKRDLMELTSRGKHVRPKRIAQNSQRSMRWPCRCRRFKCQKRLTLPKHPSHYVRPRRCPNCQERGTMRVDWCRVVVEWHAKACRCLGYGFPHARGRGFCQHNPALTIEMLQEQWEAGPRARK